ARATLRTDAEGLIIELGQARQPSSPGTLAQAAAFRAALSQVQKDPALVVYLNAEGLIGAANDAVVAGGDPQAADKWPKLRDASGLAGLKRVVWTAGFDGKEWGEQAFVEVPA